LYRKALYNSFLGGIDMRKKILLTMMLLTVCAIGTNSIFATENVEKDKKSQYKWTKYTISNGDFI
jgi:hypothetical protein